MLLSPVYFNHKLANYLTLNDSLSPLQMSLGVFKNKPDQAFFTKFSMPSLG
jgi:hypothetical protein